MTTPAALAVLRAGSNAHSLSEIGEEQSVSAKASAADDDSSSITSVLTIRKAKSNAAEASAADDDSSFVEFVSDSTPAKPTQDV